MDICGVENLMGKIKKKAVKRDKFVSKIGGMVFCVTAAAIADKKINAKALFQRTMKKLKAAQLFGEKDDIAAEISAAAISFRDKSKLKRLSEVISSAAEIFEVGIKKLSSLEIVSKAEMFLKRLMLNPRRLLYAGTAAFVLASYAILPTSAYGLETFHRDGGDSNIYERIRMEAIKERNKASALSALCDEVHRGDIKTVANNLSGTDIEAQIRKLQAGDKNEGASILEGYGKRQNGTVNAGDKLYNTSYCIKSIVSELKNKIASPKISESEREVILDQYEFITALYRNGSDNTVKAGLCGTWLLSRLGPLDTEELAVGISIMLADLTVSELSDAIELIAARSEINGDRLTALMGQGNLAVEELSQILPQTFNEDEELISFVCEGTNLAAGVAENSSKNEAEAYIALLTKAQAKMEKYYSNPVQQELAARVIPDLDDKIEMDFSRKSPAAVLSGVKYVNETSAALGEEEMSR